MFRLARDSGMDLSTLWPSSWLLCCTTKREPSSSVLPVRLLLSCKGIEEEYFDCAETHDDLRRVRSDISIASTPSTCVPESESGFSTQFYFNQTEHTPVQVSDMDPSDVVLALDLMDRTRRIFLEKHPHAGADGPEMQWANEDTARRIWRACEGNQRRADNTFLQAMGIRLRDRKLYTTLEFEKRCDMRVIGYDKDKRPVLYFCALSQRDGLAQIRDQFLATFEAARRMASSADGRMVCIVDMHGLQTRLNADFTAVNDLAETLGTVFAERMSRIIIVDFSYAAQTVWWMLKPFLSEVTQRKFSFVGAEKAGDLVRNELDEATARKVVKSFEVNRASLDKAREAHNEQTTIPFR
mmetsp:Transcript_132983/g.315160  ORF Transcript_132983/g.315160 Transcript_132983/m.315160 type:complete len:354 (-) Transcript_132983:60-1121(-)